MVATVWWVGGDLQPIRLQMRASTQCAVGIKTGEPIGRCSASKIDHCRAMRCNHSQLVDRLAGQRREDHLLPKDCAFAETTGLVTRILMRLWNGLLLLQRDRPAQHLLVVDRAMKAGNEDQEYLKSRQEDG